MSIAKLQPHRSMYLRGFDRRGAAAAMTSASAAGFTVSGLWSDQADFAVCVLFDADDQFGHLYTSRYLPDFNLTGVTLDFDLAITGCQNPTSSKFQSVPWGALSYIQRTVSGGVVTETPGTVALPIASRTGAASASITYTVNGTPVAFDRVQLVYLSNVVFDYVVAAGDTASTVAAALVSQINANGALTATQSGASFTVTAPAGRDGNGIQLLEMHKTGTCYLTPAGNSRLTGGADPASIHVHLDFSALGLASVRQLWLTFAPALNYSPVLSPYVASEWSAAFSNWTVGDTGGVTPLKIAGAGSVTIASANGAVRFAGSGWSEQAGWFIGGRAKASAGAGDSIAIAYSSQSTHDLYLGTAISTAGGSFSVSIDGGAPATVSAYADQSVGSPISGRRRLGAAIAAGTHTVTLTVASGTCVFDYLQAAVLGDPAAPAVTFSGLNCACDFDTGQTYQLPPARALWILSQAGFKGDIDFYAGVFFALKRTRNGGNFHAATVTLGGTYGTGTGFGDGDAVFLNVGGTALGAAAYPADTLTTLAQRLADGINATFVGVYAAPSGASLTITTLSPIDGFTLTASVNVGATGTVSVTGDIAAGNEGTWAVDATQTSPLNRAFRDYLTDFAAEVRAAAQTMTLAFSQELLGPPDANTPGGAWTQRFPDGTSVLTATGFGSWGAGFVEAVSGSTIQQTGHGYITGNTVHLASGSGGGVWAIAVTDANHYQLTTAISNTGGYSPGVGDAALIDLQTSQCNFNPSTTTAYLTNCYKQAAGILNTAGLTPWLQFGEFLWWYFSRYQNEAIGFAGFTAPISIGTVNPHGLTTGQKVINAGVQGNVAANGDWTVTVTDSTHFTLNGSSGNGNYVAATGTTSGGGMAFYDAYTSAAAVSALGRALAVFEHQDDDPTVNGGADAAWLAGQIKTHIDAIRTAILAVYAGAKFELLYPCDVTFGTAFWTNNEPYPQGGRLNAAVNLPSAYRTQAGSGIDRLKIEALSWGATYRTMDNAKAAIAFPKTSPMSWSAVAYLIPWFNGGCRWPREYQLAAGVPLVNFWAVDHFTLLSWPIPPPTNTSWADVAPIMPLR
jgi:hypothetical protein